MATLNLLYKDSYTIDDKIIIRIPTLKEVLEDEDSYYGLVYTITSMPVDRLVQLDDLGIDFTTIDSYELFLLFFPAIRTMDTSLIFKDLDLSKFELATDEETQTLSLVDKENDIVIDRRVHGQIAATLRKIHHLDKNRRKPANKEAKEFMLQVERDKMKRNKRSNFSTLESLIIALVNTEQFCYRYDNVLDLTIYQFNESVKQIVKKIDYEHRMSGVYAGTISAKDLSQDDLNWLVHK